MAIHPADQTEDPILLDRQDPLSVYRDQFIFPTSSSGQPITYFCGNSLGLQPKSAKSALDQVLQAWSKLAVEGHFTGDRPWMEYHHLLKNQMAELVGAMPEECTLMNTLTINIHTLLFSFYRPQGKRNVILMEEDAFPSDRYAVESHLHLHGVPKEALQYIRPRNGEYTLRFEDVQQKIRDLGERLALVYFGVPNYYTGQVVPVKSLTQTAHEVGSLVGLDLAHGVGNIPFQLHQDEVDFACWCTYKYLNGGPGSLSGIYIHEQHLHPSTFRLAGWWGQSLATRFDMRTPFDPMPSAEGWQTGNQPILAMAPLQASLDLFGQVGITALRAKSVQLTNYLEKLMDDIPQIRIITPREAAARGAQLSFFVADRGEHLFEYLIQNGVQVDWRKPNVIRCAPAPFYNSHSDVHLFAGLVEQFFQES